LSTAEQSIQFGKGGSDWKSKGISCVKFLPVHYFCLSRNIYVGMFPAPQAWKHGW